MADYVVSRHNAVMERLRRRIELFRRHHNSCESRYDNTAMERLELDRQQTYALHQRCLQTKAKRSNKHRQPQTASEQAPQRSTSNADSADGAGGGSAPGEQSRNSTLIALQETVKRKLENSSPPVSRDQVNGFSDGYPPAKKSSLEDALGNLNGSSNGGMPPLSPMDTKHGLTAELALNGASAVGSADQNGISLSAESDIRLKELKQEPMDDILPTGGGNGNIILPDLNLNEQEWTELMEEFNRSVPYEEIQELFNDGFEDRKESEVPSGPVAPSSLLPGDLANTIKAEFSPAPASSAFEQDTRTGSPHIPSSSSGPPMHASSPIMPPASASSPALSGHQHPQQQPSQPRPLQNHLLPPKDLSPAQQLQQLAAREQQRAQLMQNQQHQVQKQQKPQQQPQAPKFHQQSGHPTTWQTAPPNQSPLGGGGFGLEKPTSPSLYPPDFQNPKSLLMSGQQPTKGSPKSNAPGAYMQPSGHAMLGHGAAVSATLGHQAASGGQAAMLDYNNTKPLSHFEAGAPRGPANTQSQNKATVLNIIRQQQHSQQQQMKPRPTGLQFRPPTHLPHTQQEPGTFQSAPHVPGPGGPMVTQPSASTMTANHNNAAYLSGLQKQQQIHMQQKQFLQRQMMAEQEKQRQQQEQQMQRHLTRPPPQYQDQQNPSTQQNPFQQQPQVSQFPGSSQSMGGVGSIGGPGPGVQHLFSQNQSMMGIGQGGGPAPGAPPAPSQADLSLSSCAGGLEAQQVLYRAMSMHTNPQRMPVSAMQNYRHNVLAQQQAHLKQQQLARMPNAMANNMNSIPSSMPNTMTSNIQGAMPPQWQQQQHPGLQQGMAGQPNSNNSALPAGFPNSGFHMQSRLTKLPSNASFTQAGLGNSAAGRPMVGMNQGQMMSNMGQQRANSATLGQQQPQQGQPAPPQSQQGIPDLGQFRQPPGSQVPNRTAGMQCSQPYQANRTTSQQLPFGYNTQSAASLSSFPGESELVDSLLKSQSTQEWMDDLDELLASHQ